MPDSPLSLRRPGDVPTVHIIAPCSPFDQATLERGRDRLLAAGFHVVYTQSRDVSAAPYVNGPDERRADILLDALSSTSDIVWVARGGYGLTRLVPRLHAGLDTLAQSQSSFPTVVGFSDVTALFGLLARRGLCAVHGPLATSVANEDGDAFAALVALLKTGHVSTPLRGTQVLHEGRASRGRLFVGNLCVLTHLIGTQALPSLGGALLGLEEIGERPYRIDRMLTHLITSGALEGVRGIFVGDCSGCDDENITAYDVFKERLAPLNIPVAAGFPFGHHGRNFALPVGIEAELRTDATPTLTVRGNLFG